MEYTDIIIYEMKSVVILNSIFLINNKNMRRNNSETIRCNRVKIFFLLYLSIIFPIKFDIAKPVMVAIKTMEPYNISPFVDVRTYQVIPIYSILDAMFAIKVDKIR
jgi:hypothetical protein